MVILKRLCLLSLVLLAGLSAASAEPVFVPEKIFTHAEGHGVLTHRHGEVDRRFHVISRGQALSDGSFAIDQWITFDDGEQRKRRWILAGDGTHYVGILTDASGEVRARVDGHKLYIRYDLADVPFGTMEQVLFLQPDGQTVVNVGTVRMLGITVRKLHEIIKSPPPGG